MNTLPGIVGPGFWTPAILSPAVILAVIFAFILGWRYLKYLERRDVARWTGGMPPTQPQVPDPSVQGAGSPDRGGFTALRRAITWCAVGVALLLGALILNGGAALLLAGLIVLLVGVVRLIFVLLERP